MQTHPAPLRAAERVELALQASVMAVASAVPDQNPVR